MRIVLQKVSEGSVDVVDETSGEVDTTFEPQHIGIGYVLLVGVEDTDGAKHGYKYYKLSYKKSVW